MNKYLDQNLTSSFRKDPERKRAWAEFVNRYDWIPTKYSVLCSLHFKSGDFYTSIKGLHCLHFHAVPSLALRMNQENVNESGVVKLEVKTSQGFSKDLVLNSQQAYDSESAMTCKEEPVASSYADIFDPKVTDTPKRRVLKSSVKYFKRLSGERKKSMNRAAQKTFRQKRKIRKLENMLRSLKEKNFLQESEFNVISSMFENRSVSALLKSYVF